MKDLPGATGLVIAIVASFVLTLESPGLAGMRGLVFSIGGLLGFLCYIAGAYDADRFHQKQNQEDDATRN